jgi:two-component system, chemotaxis family, sensor kinase CheA
MDNFRKKFIEEATDLLSDLEGLLIRFEAGSEDKEKIEHIFRIMHTLKGNSAMFGFNLIDKYTHELETIYDMVRNGKLRITTDLLNLTLASVDHIRNLLDEDSSEKFEVKMTHKFLLSKINQVIGGKHEEAVAVEKVISPEKEQATTYYICFRPKPEILDNGTNPMFLVEDFKTLGDYLAIPNMDQLPSLEEMDPEKCYTSWEIILVTQEGTDKIYEIFMFAEDKCVLEVNKISDSDLLSDERFRSMLAEVASGTNFIGLHKIEEIISGTTEQTGGNEAEDYSLKTAVTSRLKNVSNIRVSSEKLDDLINLVSELVTTQAGLSLVAEKVNSKELLAIAEDVEKLTRRLRDSTFEIRLIPIETMMTRFHRLVRELSFNLKKDIALLTEGTDIELDKTMIEGLIDPIMHILRNCCDHGIESSEERKKNGKQEKGNIRFKAFHSGSNVYIQISDDGKGMDITRIRQQAISKGLIYADSVLSPKEVLDLVFLPGFSTAESVTNISGRGVGMDVVRSKISDLRGEVSIETESHKGTTITLKLPLTLSIIDGLLVSIDNAYFIIPLASINKCFEFRHETLLNAVNNLIFVNDGHIPFIYLRKEFGISTPCPFLEQVIAVEYGDVRIGLAVDKVIGEYQAVLKSLGIMYKKQDIISGATILGDGTVALVLDPNKIIAQFEYQNQKSKAL